MSGVDYREYIASNEWRTRRAEALRRAFIGKHVRYPACEVCQTAGTLHKNRPEPGEGQFRVDNSNGLEVHHVHYRNLGCEEPGDLIVLCWQCHTKTHEDRAFKMEVRRIAEERNASNGW